MAAQVQKCGEFVVEGTVRAPSGADLSLSPLAMAIWSAADGETPLRGLIDAARAVEPAADRERVFSVLDDLAAVDLVAGHQAPPTASTLGRRSLFRGLAVGVAAAAVAPAVARAAAAEQCAGTGYYAKAEQKQKQLLKKAPKQEAKAKQQAQKLDMGIEKLKGKQEQQLKVAQQQASAQLKKLKDPKAQEETQKQQQQQFQSLEKKHEQQVKQVSAQAEDKQKIAAKLPQDSCCAEEHAKQAAAFTEARSFGLGRSLVFVDLPSGATIVGETDLSRVAAGGAKDCDLRLPIEFDSSQGDNPMALAEALMSAGKGGLTTLQWGASGEFADLGKVEVEAVEAVGFDMWKGAGGTPSQVRVTLRVTSAIGEVESIMDYLDLDSDSDGISDLVD